MGDHCLCRLRLVTIAAPMPLAEDDINALRIYSLGGIGEIGRNMTVFESQGRLLIVDCGVMFPESEHPASTSSFPI